MDMGGSGGGHLLRLGEEENSGGGTRTRANAAKIDANMFDSAENFKAAN